MPTLTREERAANAKVAIDRRFSSKQQAFLYFVLSQYISVGVDELDQQKLTPLLRLKYHNSIANAVADLGKPEEINRIFVGFQNFCIKRVRAPERPFFSRYLIPTDYSLRPSIPILLI
jgi:type I restriction enzyme R subunit